MPNWEGNNEIRLNEAMLEVGSGLSLSKTRDALQNKKRYTITPDSIFKKYRVVQGLSSGNNLITHNLGLSNTATIVEVRDNVTGSEISVRVLSESTNSLVINVPSALTNCRITIMG